jgi:hypothetical protein
LDVHKDTIAVAIVAPDREAPIYWSEIANTPTAVKRLLHKLASDGEVLGVCYEAGPCGYGLYRQITGTWPDEQPTERSQLALDHVQCRLRVELGPARRQPVPVQRHRGAA